jgi:tetratricopeptide (TPR) repeat protein
LDLLGNTHILSGDLINAAAHYEQAIGLFQDLDDRRGLASTLGTLMGCDGGCETDTAVAAQPQRLDFAAAGDLVLKLTREIGWRTGEAIALSMVGRHLGARGAYARALRLAQRAVALAEEIEHREWLAHAHDTAGVLYLDLLALPAARQQLEQAWVLATESGALFHVYCTIGFLASTYVLQGELGRAEATLAAAPAFDAAAPTVAQRQVLCVQAELALARCDPTLALQVVDRLIASAAHAAGERVVPRLSALRGEALMALQRWPEAEAALQAARQGALAQGARPRLWRIHAALGRLYRAQARQTDAERAWRVAQAIIQELAADVPDPGLRQNFVQAATALLPPR